MKKQKLKNYLKIGILLFGISVILTNCQNDDNAIIDESQLEQTTPLVLNHLIPFNQTQHYNKLESKINKLKDKANNYNSQNRTENDDIEILTDQVLYITYASTHTYSFKVLRAEPQAYVENIVLHYNIDNQDYNEYIVQYNVTAEEFVNLNNGDLLQSSENVTIIDLENGFFDNNISARGCDRVCETIFVDCSSGDHHSGNVGEWGSCTASESPSAYQSCSTNCELDNEITAPDGPSGGGGGGGNTTVVSNPIPTEPCDNNSTGGIGITSSDGGCLTVTPKDPTPEVPTDPCDELNKLSLDFGTKNALSDLGENTNQVNEKGYALKKNNSDGSFRTPEETPASQVSANGENAAIPIKNYLGNEYIGFFHTHPRASDGWYPMFSIGDLNSLFYLALKHNSNGQTKNYSEYVVTLTVPQGSYAIKIKDWFKFSIARNSKWNGRKGILKTLKDDYQNRDAQGNLNYLEKDILDLFKEFDMGVGLYKANEDLTEWSELVHDLNPLSPNFGYAKELPCN